MDTDKDVTFRRETSLFNDWRRDLVACGLETLSPNGLLCPLCWKEEDIAAFSCEHIVPSAVGGKRQRVLTCRRCNNDQGSDLDSHLSSYQSSIDASRGHGAFPAIVRINGKRLAANIEWGTHTKSIRVAGKATDSRDEGLVQEDFRDGKVEDIGFSLELGYAPDKLHTAVLRAAYLILFQGFGYRYAKDETVQRIRNRICDSSVSVPRLDSMIIGLQNFNPPSDQQHFFVPASLDGVEIFLVIIRLRKITTSYLGALLPGACPRSPEFFELVERYAHDNGNHELSIPRNAFIS